MAVGIVVGNVGFHRLAVYPVHQQHGEHLVIAAAVYKQFLLQILHRRDICRVDKLQFLGYLPIRLAPAFLFVGKAFQGIVSPRLRVFHLEHYGKGAAAAIGLAVIVEHWLQVSQLVQILLCVAYGCYIF